MSFLNKFRSDNFNNGRYSVSGATQYAQYKWFFKTKDSLYSSPVSDYNGNVYVGSNDGSLYAVSNSGYKLWSYKTNGDIVSSPGISKLKNLHVGSYDHNLYSFHLNGTRLWKYTTGGPIYSSPAYGNNNTVYITSFDSNLYALSAHGSLLYSVSTNGPIYSSPAVDKSGNVYFGSLDGYFYSVSGSTGNTLWRVEVNTGVGIYSSPVIASSTQNTVYFTASNITYFPYLYALSTVTGSVLWHTLLSTSPVSNIYTSPSILSDGSLLIPTSAFQLLRIRSTDGVISYDFPTSSPEVIGSSSHANSIQGSVVVDSDDTIYFIGNFIYCYVLYGTVYRPLYYATYDYSGEHVSRLSQSERSSVLSDSEGLHSDSSSFSKSLSGMKISETYSENHSLLRGYIDSNKNVNDNSVASQFYTHFDYPSPSLSRSSNLLDSTVINSLSLSSSSSTTAATSTTVHTPFDKSMSMSISSSNNNNTTIFTPTSFTMTSSMLIGNDGSLYVSSPDGNLYCIYNPYTNINTRLSSLIADILFIMPLMIIFLFTCAWYINYRVMTRYHQQVNRQGRELTREELEQIMSVLEGQLLLRVIHANQIRATAPVEENYLRGNWRVCKKLPDELDFDNNCVVCFNPLFAQECIGINEDHNKAIPNATNFIATNNSNSNSNSSSNSNSNIQSEYKSDDYAISSRLQPGSSDVSAVQTSSSRNRSTSWHSKGATVSSLINSIRSASINDHSHNQSSSHNIITTDTADTNITSSDTLISQSTAVELPCGHIFHEECIRAWAESHNNCPVCRYKPTKEEENFGASAGDNEARERSVLSFHSYKNSNYEESSRLQTGSSDDSSHSSSSPFVPANQDSSDQSTISSTIISANRPQHGLELATITRNSYTHVPTNEVNNSSI